MPFCAGAVLLRGFRVSEGVEFQEVVQKYNPELSDQYRGTSPRRLVPGTQVVLGGGGEGEERGGEERGGEERGGKEGGGVEGGEGKREEEWKEGRGSGGRNGKGGW